MAHHSFPVMARGDHTLGPETSYSATASLDMTWPIFKGEILPIAVISMTISTCLPSFERTANAHRCAHSRPLPRFSFAPINAHFYGLDGGDLDLDPLVQVFKPSARAGIQQTMSFFCSSHLTKDNLKSIIVFLGMTG